MNKIFDIASLNFPKSLLFVVGKMLFLFILCLVLYHQLFVKYNLEELTAEFSRATSESSIFVFIFVLFLLPINWLLESAKWKTLVSVFQNFSWKQSINSVLSGVSVAILTPGRIGEYGGRLIGVKAENRTKALLANFVSSLSQNIVNISIGLLCALFFVYRFLDFQIGVQISLAVMGLGVLSVFLIVYFRIDLLKNVLAYLPDYKWLQKVKQSTKPFEKLKNEDLFSVLGFSFMRYLVYSLQYVLLLHFFGVTEDTTAAFLGVGTIYFLQSNLPLPPALSVLLRGEMAIFLWSYFSSNVLGILAATFTLWWINLVVPSLLGAIIISKTDFTKDTL